jgi:Protein of unknown function C-terminus (DUF2451)
MISRSLSHSDEDELTNEALGSTSSSSISDQRTSPNLKNAKWSLMSFVRRPQHSGSINTSSASFLGVRLSTRGEYKSPLCTAAKELPIKPPNIFPSSSKSWIASDSRKSDTLKADEQTPGQTIDDALRSLYDESNGFLGAKKSCSCVLGSSIWWNLDGNYCYTYTKGDRDTKAVSHRHEHNHCVSDVDENSIDEIALTSQLFKDLHADPLISVLDRFSDVNNVTFRENDDPSVVDTNVRDFVEDYDDDDFGDFQSASCSAVAVSLFLEEYDTRNECVEGCSVLANPPCDIDPNVESLQEEMLKPVVRAMSFDDCENETALLHYIDSLCGSPVESASITASPSINTPDLVRLVDEVIQSSYDVGTEAVAIEAVASSRRALPLQHSESNIIDNDSRMSPTYHNDIASSWVSDQAIIVDGGIIAALPPLSMVLPVGNNLSTLEARFTRRLQQQYFVNERESIEPVANLSADSSSILKCNPSDLTSYYFTCNDIDDTISVIQSLSWQHVPLISGEVTCTTVGGSSKSLSRLDSVESLAFWDEHITSRLCQLDTSLEYIQSKTLLHIQPFQPTLFRANDLIHEWDQNLRLAFMYWQRSKQSLTQVMGCERDANGLVGATLLLKTWQEQEEYKFLDCVLDELDDILHKEKELLLRIDRFDVKDFNAFDKYLTVLQLAKVLEDRVSNGRLANLLCLNVLRDRLQNVGLRFWNRLLDITKSFVVHSCKTSISFDWNEYERLFRAFLDLKSHGIVNLSPDTVEIHSSWADNILTAFAYEVDAAFASALLYPTDCKSHHENDLKQFAHDLDLYWGDYSKLRAISRNLVCVRFELEWNMNYLPYVIHKLCKRLTDILHSYFSFVKRHDELFRVQLVRESGFFASNMERHDLRCVHDKLSCYSPKLWEHCESIIAKCLDEFLNFSQKRTLFQRRDNGVDDTLWRDDLNHNYMVNVFVSSFLSFKALFLGSLEGSSTNREVSTEVHSLISDKLSKVYSRHLRLLHVEAMNTVGRCLANETWILGNTASLQLDPGQTDHSKLSIRQLLTMALQSASKCLRPFSRMTRYSFSGFDDFVNPFDSPTFTIETESLILLLDDSEHEDALIYEKLCSLRSDRDRSHLLAPASVTKELIVWLSRLLCVMERLPLIAENASEVIINLCDLYFTTVLRLCSGSSKCDRLILGEDYPSPFLLDEEFFLKGSTKKTNGTPIFGSFRSSQQKILHPKRKNGSDVSFPVCLDGDICVPIPKDLPKIQNLHFFIRRAQTSLRHVVNLDMVDSWLNDPNADASEGQGCEVARVLCKRQVAIWSCFTVAAFVRLLVVAAKRNISSAFAPEDFSENKLIALQAYGDSVLDVVPTLAQVASQIACTRAIKGSNVVKEILNIGAGWEECKLHEYPNDYVDDLCNRCSLVWGHLCAFTELPGVILEETWEGLVSASYLALLEGYSRVRRCYTEGRAHMTLDLASFRAGISPRSVSERVESLMQKNLPPNINPEVGSKYVETYIKAFYYPKDDVIAWINQHWNQYKMNQVLALAVTAILSCSDPSSEKQVSFTLDDIKALYNVNDDI